jgi:hypothetical protein
VLARAGEIEVEQQVCWYLTSAEQVHELLPLPLIVVGVLLRLAVHTLPQQQLNDPQVEVSDLSRFSQLHAAEEVLAFVLREPDQPTMLSSVLSIGRQMMF